MSNFNFLILKLVFATHNQNKFKEVKALMPAFINLLSLHDIGCMKDIQETENTIEGNAILKATFVSANFGYNCFADDTGLEVDALGGEPGVYSARYAGEQKRSDDNITLLLKNLNDKKQRSAQFKTIIALVINKEKIIFEGICKGSITHKKRGRLGFGYDPIFVPEGAQQTFSEMTQDQKNQYSHRGKAISQLITYLQEA